MGEIVNLRRVKKRRALEVERQAAAENRIQHGRSAALKQSDATKQARETAQLDQAKLDRPDEP